LKLRVEQTFDAATALPGHERCDVLHGHTYKVEMMVQGQEQAGLLVDFSQLKDTLRQAVDAYDHRDLSKVFPYPSCEAIGLALAKDLKSKIPQFSSLRIWEGEGKWVEVESQEV
jgi:6-pyruvoyltetrahydropterin/6-carboxytetrahydropterin synthase